jgi:hypothetical protein
MSDNELKDYGKEKTIVNKALDWAGTLFLSSSAKSIRFFKDSEGNLLGFPVVLLDPTNVGSKILGMGKVSIADPNAANSNARVFGDPENAIGVGAFVSLLTQAAQMLYNNTGTGTMEVQRTPVVFTTNGGFTAAGNTAFWTPAAGKKFRLLGGILTISKEAACAGAQYIMLLDAAGWIMRFDISNAALVATGNVIVIPFNLPRNGYLSTAANNVLNLKLNGAFTAGSCALVTWGTEE